VVIDAPATGTALALLSVAAGVKGIAPFGTLNSLATEVERFLADPNRFGVLLTLTPEELALREALEAASSLSRELGIHRVAAILSAVPEALFAADELATVAALKEHCRLARRRVEAAGSAIRARRELERGGLRVIELPMLFSPALGAAQIHQLSRRLEAEFFE
jgi:anion-transporting  ArsA/GET3 family ATPase